MSRVLLLTRHFNDNCGTVFQTYATCELLKQCGHEVSVLNLTDRSYIKELCSLKGILRALTIIKFALFRKKYFSNLTRQISRLSDFKQFDADYIVVGSDQVWNKSVTKSLFKDYFLVSVPDNIQRISLASSFAGDSWKEQDSDTNEISEALHKFVAVSVREDSGVLICNQVFNIPATQLVDPTLALGDFTCFISRNLKERNEVLFYSFKSDGYVKKVVDYITTKTGAKARSITIVKRNERNKYLLAHPFSLGPKDWLNYIARSKYIVTDSFHGIVFSILNHRQFVAVRAHEDRFSRIESLLKLLCLQNRIALSFEEFVSNYEQYMSPIDYKYVDEIITSQRELFYSFIRKNIK